MIDVIEIVTLAFSFVAFIFVMITYQGISTKSRSKYIAKFIFLGVGFILANRVFTNVEALGLNTMFNFMEHLSIMIAAGIFLYIVWYTNREVNN
jgi:high-affinity Fe2+/Pb2+ permease